MKERTALLLLLVLCIADGILLRGNNVSLRDSRSLVKRAAGPKVTELEEFDDGRCNSDKLQRIMRENMKGDYQSVSMKIMKYAEESIGGPFSVICSRNDFAYVTRARIFCLNSVNGLNCFAYLTEQ